DAIPGDVDGAAGAARFYFPAGITEDAQGTIFIADTHNNAIRALSSAGQVSTLPVQQELVGPSGIAVGEEGVIYFSEPLLNVIEKILPDGAVVLVAGVLGVAGSTDGISSFSLFNMPTGLAVDHQSNLYVADTANHAIRQIAPDGTVSTIAGTAEAAGYADGPV